MAAIFVALYAVCVLTPTAALALEGRCLKDNGAHTHQHAAATHTHDHAGAGHAHQHTDGVKQALHDSAGQGDTDDKGPVGKCCAVMFMSAITPELGVAPAPATVTRSAFAGITQSFSGVPPGKLIRPPKLPS